MTILTINGRTDKKLDKLNLPLVTGLESPTAPPICSDADAENADNDVIIQRRSNRLLSPLSVLLFFAAITVMCLSIVGGIYIYREYALQTIHRMRFHGFCQIPYDSNSVDNRAMMYMNQDLWHDNIMNDDNYLVDPEEDNERERIPLFSGLANIEKDIAKNFFKEELEIDLSVEQSYTKIDVPDFRDSRRGRFLHDFKNNQSCIIDKYARRCFVMPLDRETVLPPHSFYDLVNKMWNGYYDIDTNVVRKNMRVIIPAVTDLKSVAPRIAEECIGMNIYMLEKYVKGIFKRSAELPETAKFAEFSGKHIVEFDLVNIAEIEDFERLPK